MEMTKEEKELLIKDLCGRLPYGVKVKVFDKDILLYDSKDGFIKGKENMEDDDFVVKCHNDSWVISCEDFKPYLRPMSSMTEEEYTEYRTMQGRNCDYGEATICVSKSLYPRHLYDDGEPVKITVFYPNPVIQDWLNKKMFDYRGLIEKGLALEAPCGMYESLNNTTGNE